MTEPTTVSCGICGITGNEPAIRPGLTQWAVRPAGHSAWEPLLRCVDHDACRARVAGAGKVWPVIEGKTNPADVAKAAGWRMAAGDAASRKREYAEFTRTHPGMTDPRPPVEDPATGSFRFAPPKPLAAIPSVEPPRPAVSRDESEEWW